MNGQTFRKLARMHKIPQGTLEKDYALTNLLSLISDFPKLNRMIFKGGTAIKKIYFKDFRFSEDLDFVCLEDIVDDFINYIKNNMKNLDVEFTEISNIEKFGHSFKVKYIQSTGAMTSIKVDLSLRGDVMMEPVTRPILHFYDTLQDEFSTPVMNLEEIMAEKIRAMTYSKHPRHLYDIQYLYNHGVRINSSMVRTKIKFIHNEDFDINRFKQGLPEKAQKWIDNLKPLLPADPPSFDDVSRDVLGIVANAMK